MQQQTIDGFVLHFDDRGRITYHDASRLMDHGKKYCPRCQSVKSRNDFSPQSGKRKRADGLRYMCKSCSTKEQQKYSGGPSTKSKDANVKSRKRYGSFDEITPNDVRNALKASNNTCWYCGHGIKDGYQLDHIFPVSRGGRNVADNIAIACIDCNRKKYNILAPEWIPSRYMTEDSIKLYIATFNATAKNGDLHKPHVSRDDKAWDSLLYATMLLAKIKLSAA